jgi:hypothetical protein
LPASINDEGGLQKIRSRPPQKIVLRVIGKAYNSSWSDPMLWLRGAKNVS